MRERHPPAHKTTQASALATGALLGRREGASRLGSTCLDGNRALLVGKRGIEIVSVPRLRRLWREKTTTEIQAVAVCGGTKARIIPEGYPFPVEEIDLTAPATFGKDGAPTVRVAPVIALRFSSRGWPRSRAVNNCARVGESPPRRLASASVC